jgi:hypothetical protein
MAWSGKFEVSEWCSVRRVSGFCTIIYHHNNKIMKCSWNSNQLPAIIRRFQLEHPNAVPIWTEVAMLPEISLELVRNEPN